jgi:hypothetical protein
MKNYFKQFTGKIQYNTNTQQEFSFDIEDTDDLTDEIEKSLIEIKNTWNIPDDEIQAAIESRRLSRKQN